MLGSKPPLLGPFKILSNIINGMRMEDMGKKKREDFNQKTRKIQIALIKIKNHNLFRFEILISVHWCMGMMLIFFIRNIEFLFN